LELFSHMLVVCSAELWVLRRGADAVGEEYFRGGDLLYLTSRVSFCLYYYFASQVTYVSIVSLVCKRCDLCCNVCL